MRAKNIKEMAILKAGDLIGDPTKMIPQKEGEEPSDYTERVKDLHKRIFEYCKEKGTPEELTALQAELDPANLEAYRSIGADLPAQDVPVSITLGTFLFDLFNLTSPRSLAPLQARLINSKAEKMAVWTKKDAFDIADDILKQIRPGLEDPNIFKNIRITVCSEIEGKEPVYFQVNHGAAPLFPKVVDAAVDLFMPPDAASTKFSKAAKAQTKKE